MRNTLYLFLLAIGLAVACEPAAENDTTEETATEEPAAEEMTDEAEESAAEMEITAPSGDNYTTTIVEEGIPSPRKEMKATIGDAEVIINYGSPSVRGRTIWGDLEPYDEVWRTGANKATTISFSKDVKVQGKDLAAGTYALFTIPREGDWTVIFNSKPDQFGDYNYDEGDDTLRVEATPSMLEEAVEQMEFVLEGDQIVLRWDKVSVPFTVAG
ncbi:MAG: DUF2911 domain-containing protein [Bacteroidota bacterium]